MLWNIFDVLFEFWCSDFCSSDLFPYFISFKKISSEHYVRRFFRNWTAKLIVFHANVICWLIRKIAFHESSHVFMRLFNSSSFILLKRTISKCKVRWLLSYRRTSNSFLHKRSNNFETRQTLHICKIHKSVCCFCATIFLWSFWYFFEQFFFV